MHKENENIRSQLAKLSEKIGQSIWRWGQNQFESREIQKKIIKLSTKDSAFSKDGELNDWKIKWGSLVLGIFNWYLISLIFLGVVAFENFKVIILGLVILWWWFLPKYQVYIYCNQFIASSINKLRGESNRAKMVLSLPNLLRDLANNSLAMNVGHDSIEFRRDEKYGIVMDFVMKGKTVNDRLRSWEQSKFQQCYVIPTIFDEKSRPMLILHSGFSVSLSYYAEKNWTDFSKKVIEDKAIAMAFPEIRKEYKMIKKEEEAERIMRNYAGVASIRGINKRIGAVLATITRKKDDWNITPWKLEDYLEGNERYARFRLKLQKDAEFSHVVKLKSTLERALNADVTLSAVPNDKGSITMLVIFDTYLKQYQKPFAEILDLNQQDKLYIGESITGSLIVDYNSKANHALFIGESGSGKSVQIANYLTQLINLENYGHKEVYITSSAKVSDFVSFEEQGAHLVEGIESSISMANTIMEIAKHRETIFKDKKVKNIEDHNRNVPQSEQMPRIVFVFDEYETGLQRDSKIETVVTELLNIGRSSGITVLIGSQSLLKQDIGSIRDKVQVKFIGKLKKDVAISCGEKDIGEYFAHFDGATEGIFFFEGNNLGLPKGRVLHGTSVFQLIQTPYSADWEDYVPELCGSGVSKNNLRNESDSQKWDIIDI